MSYADSSGIDKGSQMRLRNIYEDWTAVMDVLIDADEFCSVDLDCEKHAYRSVIKKLQAIGAVRRVGQRRQEYKNCSNLVYEWAWEPAVVEKLREYVEDRDQLPCGHRAHVHHHDDGYGCQYCDEQRDFTRETVEAVIFE